MRTCLVNQPGEEPYLKNDYLAQNDPNPALPGIQDDYISKAAPVCDCLVSMPSPTAPKEPLKQEAKRHISEISVRAFRKFHRKREIMGVLWGTYVNQELKIAVTNVSTELAIKSQRNLREKEINKMVPKEYWGYKYIFRKEEATELPLHRQGVDMELN